MVSDTIPQPVLQDYQTRTINDAKNPFYSNAENTSLDAEVLFNELLPLGYVPFTAREEAETIHEEQLWAWAHEGKYGPIGPYVAPPPVPESAQWAAPLTTEAVIVLQQKVADLEVMVDQLHKRIKALEEAP